MAEFNDAADNGFRTCNAVQEEIDSKRVLLLFLYLRQMEALYYGICIH